MGESVTGDDGTSQRNAACFDGFVNGCTWPGELTSTNHMIDGSINEFYKAQFACDYRRN
jgi:hypothetical protein